MMKPYQVVTQTASDVLLLQAILDIRPDDPKIAFVAAGGWSSADTYSRTRLMLDEANVAIVVGADTFNSDEAEGRREFLHRSLGDVTLHKKYCVAVIAPDIEALLFRERSLLEQLVGREVSELELVRAEYEPKRVLQSLLHPVSLADAFTDRLPRIDTSSLANDPELRALKKFLPRVRQNAPALR